jgi:DNA-binding transcriptional MerR regulator
MATKTAFSPAEICEMFGISKTTLFRWEEEGKISPVLRKINKVREYTKQHIREIAQMQVENLNELYTHAAEVENKAQMKQVHENLTRIKILYLEDVTGLFELSQQNNLSEDTIRDLLNKAMELDTKSQLFAEIINVLHSSVEKRSKNT